MKHADIAIMTHGSDRLGSYQVDPARYGGFPGGWSKPSRLLRLVRNWLERRRQRHTLKQLDDRILKDIGLTRFDVARELEKPFWRP